MKTLLSQFCEEFDGVVRPLLQPLTQSADVLNRVSDQKAVKGVLPTVLDVRHHIGSLADKVAEQQAYVLIFGPLKSGKSTLMNAISAAYVSEVTTLPAYPAMVYVSHADTVSFTITRYNGEIEAFDDMAAMRTLMEWAHGELADRLREVEERGESFDPQIHCPTAIRRVDVRLPATELEQSSAALVDTPGLYSRMKFGYDRMTREFRNTASCAIFVVKTDNLFLEQVFDEFGDLLKNFSRVFLVVNVDSTKRDLSPSGELEPSLECENPDRIIRAFENLAMTAPLKQALEDGRLKLYPVDLLKAASMRLRKVDEEPGHEEAGSPDLQTFRAFSHDLTEYLNSTDYLVAFLGDSIKQAWSLLDELRELEAHPAAQAVATQVSELEVELDHCTHLEQAIGRLEDTPWDDYFGPLSEDLHSIASGRVEKLRDQSSFEVTDALENWFSGDGSYRSLIEDLLQPALDQSRSDLVTTAGGVLETVASTDTAGAQVPEPVRTDLESLDLDLGKLGRSCLAHVDPGSGLARGKLPCATEGIPVRRGILDVLLFRSKTKVGRRLFGPNEGAPIARQVKLRKLGDVGRDAIHDQVEDAFDDFFDGALDHLANHVLTLYIQALRKTIRSELRKVADSTALRRATVERRLSELREVSTSLAAVQDVVVDATASLGELSRRYGETDPELLQQPVSDVDEQVLGELLAAKLAQEAGEVESEDSEDDDELVQNAPADEAAGDGAGASTAGPLQVPVDPASRFSEEDVDDAPPPIRLTVAEHGEGRGVPYLDKGNGHANGNGEANGANGSGLSTSPEDRGL